MLEYTPGAKNEKAKGTYKSVGVGVSLTLEGEGE